MWNFHANIPFLSILQVTNLHIDLRHLIGVLMKLPHAGQDELKQPERVIDIMVEWDQILLNDLSDYRLSLG